MTSYGIWFSGRRTPITVDARDRAEAIKKARKKKKRGGDSVERARKLTPSEIKTAKSGRWVRTGKNGEKPGYSGKRGYGPKPKAKS